MKGRTIAVLQLLLALFYVSAGLAKLIGIETAVSDFAAIGLGQWLRVATGVLEIAGGLALCVPAYAGFGALLLACIMTGAAIARLTVLDGSAAPAVMLLAIDAMVAYYWLRDWGRDLLEDSLDDDFGTLVR
jgi:uncharacterized membrane protein YphA (DoxX/SURF4 family)